MRERGSGEALQHEAKPSASEAGKHCKMLLPPAPPACKTVAFYGMDKIATLATSRFRSTLNVAARKSSTLKLNARMIALLQKALRLSPATCLKSGTIPAHTEDVIHKW